jgi:hypothetical protein
LSLLLSSCVSGGEARGIVDEFIELAGEWISDFCNSSTALSFIAFGLLFHKIKNKKLWEEQGLTHAK